MKPLRISRKRSIARAVNMQPLSPAYLKGKSLGEIERIQLDYGNRKVAAADLFEISGQVGERIEIENSTPALERIGEGMKSGSLYVFGDAGAFAGANMQGGVIEISGSCGDFSGCSMRGGLLKIKKNAGNYLGSGDPGGKHGMNEACIVVHGNAGIRMGDRMRRGLIVVCGSTGEGAASGMIAGTVLLLGKAAKNPGVCMRRGTIICRNRPQIHADSFQEQRLEYFGLLKSIQAELLKSDTRIDLTDCLGSPKTRLVGDTVFGGMGEMLIFDG